MKTTNIEDLVRTTDHNGDVMPSFLGTPTAEEASKLGLVYSYKLDTSLSRVPLMPMYWLRLTDMGLAAKANLMSATTGN